MFIVAEEIGQFQQAGDIRFARPGFAQYAQCFLPAQQRLPAPFPIHRREVFQRPRKEVPRLGWRSLAHGTPARLQVPFRRRTQFSGAFIMLTQQPGEFLQPAGLRGLFFQPLRRHLVQGCPFALEYALVGHFLQQVLVEVPFHIALEGRFRLGFHKTARLQGSERLGSTLRSQGFHPSGPETPPEDCAALQGGPFRLGQAAQAGQQQVLQGGWQGLFLQFFREDAPVIAARIQDGVVNEPVDHFLHIIRDALRALHQQFDDLRRHPLHPLQDFPDELAHIRIGERRHPDGCTPFPALLIFCLGGREQIAQRFGRLPVRPGCTEDERPVSRWAFLITQPDLRQVFPGGRVGPLHIFQQQHHRALLAHCQQQFPADHQRPPFHLGGVVAHRADMRAVRERQAHQQSQGMCLFLVILQPGKFPEAFHPLLFRQFQRRVFGDLEAVEPHAPNQGKRLAGVIRKGPGAQESEGLRAQVQPFAHILQQPALAHSRVAQHLCPDRSVPRVGALIGALQGLRFDRPPDGARLHARHPACDAAEGPRLGPPHQVGLQRLALALHGQRRHWCYIEHPPHVTISIVGDQDPTRRRR